MPARLALEPDEKLEQRSLVLGPHGPQVERSSRRAGRRRPRGGQGRRWSRLDGKPSTVAAMGDALLQPPRQPRARPAGAHARPPRHARAAAGDRARRSASATGSAGSGARRRPPTSASWSSIHSARHVESIRELCLSGGGADRRRHLRRRGLLPAALHAAGGACAMTRALLGGEDRSASARVRPSGHHAEPERAMGFCLFDNVAIAAELAIRELGARAGARPRLGRPPRQRHRRGLPPPRRRPLRQHPPGRDLPRHRPLRRLRLRRGRGLHDQPAGPGRSERGTLALAARAHRAPGRRPHSTPTSSSSRPASTPTATTRSPTAALEAASFAQMARHVRELAAGLGAPLGAVLEGGYEPPALAESVVATMAALGGEGEAIEAAPEALLTSRAAAGVARYWCSVSTHGTPRVRPDPRPPLDRFEPLLGDGYARDRAAADARPRASSRDGRSGTSARPLRGGGVAEMLHSLLPYVRGAGVDTRWVVLREQRRVLRADQAAPQPPPRRPRRRRRARRGERELYERGAARTAPASSPRCCRSGDVVFLHDPQTAGLVAGGEGDRGAGRLALPHRRRPARTSSSARAWDFLAPLRRARRRLRLLPPRVRLGRARPPTRSAVMAPSIDPFSPKNQELDAATVEAILARSGLAADGLAAAPTLRPRRRHPRPGRAPGRDPPGGAAPRRTRAWSPRSRAGTGSRTTLGLLACFERHLADEDLHLVLAGPATAAVADDPEGAAVWRRGRRRPGAS